MVMKVETVISAALKRTESFLLQKRNEEQKPSVPASRMAASPPKSSIVRKIKVSVKEKWDLKRGISIVAREQAIVISSSKRKRRSSRATGKR